LAQAAKLMFLALASVPSPPPEHTSKLFWGSKIGSGVVCYRENQQWGIIVSSTTIKFKN